MIPNIKKFFWKDIRDTVIRINPELGKIIDELEPVFPLYKASLPFGAEFVKQGKLYLPNAHGEMVPLTDSTISREIKEDLEYNIGTNPVSMVLSKAAELFLSLNDTTFPFFLGCLTPGKLLSTSRVLSPDFSHQPAFLWNITAGARNLIMLPKISSTTGYNRLRKELQLDLDKPKGAFEHWQLFKEIANHNSFNDEWSMDILFFSKAWFESLNDEAWREFHRYLLKSAWDGSEFWRNRFIWDLIFSYIQRLKNIRTNTDIANIAKHILSISVGAIPGMAPATNDAFAPISGIQKIFKEVYNSNNYLPIILQSKYFSLYKPSEPVYYSLQYPTTLEFPVNNNDNTSALSNLYDIKSLLEKYYRCLQNGGMNINHTPLADSLDLVEFKYLHDSNNGKYRDIQSTSIIQQTDLRFTYISGMSDLDFPAQSSFFKGCIQVSHKKKN